MRTLFVLAFAVLFGVQVAYAQEHPGAGRMEISAFPGGGMFFGSSSTETEPGFGNYTVGAG